MKKQHTTIHDIARELNVSASTVSRALTDHPRISLSTREAVKKVAALHNYQPNVVASSLRKGSSKTVGVIVPRINRNFFSSVIGGMEELLAASGYHLMICQTHEKLGNEVSAIQTLVNARVDAVMLSISMETFDYEHIRALTERGIRLFFFDRAASGIQTGSVVVDDRLGAYLSVNHLLEQGYRRIMHVAGAERINIYRGRKEGYLQAMHEAGIDVHPSWIMETSLVQEDGESAFRSSSKMKPDAFFCAGDFAALGVMQAARKAGLNVPGDLGITGFANEPFTAFIDPPLTTVDQRGAEMGSLVAEMFLKCEEEGRISASCEQLILEPELIIRESSVIQKKPDNYGN
ncbi:MAG: LacI family transcriptional regulator [Bacteroidia bacterium]|nr:MAG: LacI family transcriptional regulator [Bacteroidia bacterium]